MNPQEKELVEYKIINYPIEEKEEEERVIEIKAGKSWTDDDKVKQYEGIKFKIPKEISNNKLTTFAVMSITKKNHETYILHLHSHDFDVNKLKEHYEISQKDEYCMIDAGGDIEITLTIKKEILSKWIGIPTGEIRRAFDSIKLGLTYNLLASIPRKILVKQNEVAILIPKNDKVDNANVCIYILEGRHPLDSVGPIKWY